MLNNKKNILSYIGYKLKSELKVETSRNYLGIFWWLLEPALMLGVFYFVFGILLSYGREGFDSYLLVGITFWLIFSNTVSNSCNAIQSGAGVMQQVYLPKWIFPLVTILSHFIKFIFVFIVLLIYLFTIGQENLAIQWVDLTLMMMAYLFFTTGVCFFIASVIPTFPDLKFVVQAGIQMLMFGSGIFYEYSMIPDKYFDLFLMNPVALGIYELRESLLHATSIQYSSLIYLSGLGLAFFLIGFTILKLFDKHYPRFIF